MKKKSLIIALSSLAGVGLTSLGLFAAKAKNQADSLLDNLSPASPKDKTLLLINNSILRQQECLKNIELILASVHDRASGDLAAKHLAKLVAACNNANFTMHYELVSLREDDKLSAEQNYMLQVEPLKKRINEQIRTIFGAKLCYNSRSLGKAIFPLLS